MAIVRVDLAERSQEEREAIIAEMTDVMARHGSRRENVQVLLLEHPTNCWGHGGITYEKLLAQR
jgi:phenylpyruvate tautomerase PptA (4-oxalocrotonate tautomerase family)